MAVLAPRNGLVLPRGFRKPSNPVLDPTHPLSRGLVGFWPLGDNASGITQDISGFGNAGSLTSITGLGASHHGGQATKFNGSSSVVKATSVPASANVSVVAWCNPSSWPGVGTIFSRDPGNGSLYWTAEIGGSGTIQYAFVNSGGYNGGGGGTKVLAIGTWHQVAITFDGTTMRGYVDAALDASNTKAGNFSGLGDTVEFGNWNGVSRYFPGSIECVRIYNRPLSLVEIQQLYAEPYAGVYEAGSIALGGFVNAPGGGALPSGAIMMPSIRLAS